MAGPVYKRSGEVIEAGVGDELVALDLRDGDCFGFNEVAASVWRSLAEPKRFEQLRDELLEQYDVSSDQCTLDLQTLLDQLAGKGLVEKKPELRFYRIGGDLRPKVPDRRSMCDKDIWEKGIARG